MGCGVSDDSGATGYEWGFQEPNEASGAHRTD
jgi:hypothetical protein